MKYFIFNILLISVVCNIHSQDPNWSLDKSQYQYSMTFTTFLNVNGVTLNSTNDKVAAFVNGEVRGVANLVYVSAAKKYVAYLTVYANINNEVINFKIYDSTSNTTVNTDNTINFSIDDNVGGIFQSYSIASPALHNEAVLNSFSFSGITSVSESINNTTITIVVPFNTDISNLVPEFSLSKGAHLFKNQEHITPGTTVEDFTNTITYQVVSENEAVLTTYQVKVVENSEDVDTPVLLLTSDAKDFVNEAPIIINMETNTPITGFEKEDIVLTNAIVSSIKKENDLLYTLTIVPIQQGVFSITIPEGKVYNTINEENISSNSLSFTYDVTPPNLVSIKRKAPTDEVTESTTLVFTIVFNEAVTNVTASDFKSSMEATKTVVKESDTTFTVTLSEITNFGVVTLHIDDSNDLQDKAGNLFLNSSYTVYQN